MDLLEDEESYQDFIREDDSGNFLQTIRKHGMINWFSDGLSGRFTGEKISGKGNLMTAKINGSTTACSFEFRNGEMVLVHICADPNCGYKK